MQNSITVLVIDDDTMIRKLLHIALASKGFKVFTASNGQEGLDTAKTDEIDVILLDWMMPEMDGMAVLEELKRDRDTKRIPVLMLTAKDGCKDIELAIDKGADDYIVKPFNPYEVPEMVQKHLEKIHNGTNIHKQGILSRIFANHS